MFKKLIFLFALVLIYSLSMGQTDSLDIKGNVSAVSFGNAAYFLASNEGKVNFYEFKIDSKELKLISIFNENTSIYVADSKLIIRSGSVFYNYDQILGLQSIYSSNNILVQWVTLNKEINSLVFWEKYGSDYWLMEFNCNNYSTKQIAVLDTQYSFDYLPKRKGYLLTRRIRESNNKLQNIHKYIDSMGSLISIDEKIETAHPVIAEHDDYVIIRNNRKLCKTTDFISFDYDVFSHIELFYGSIHYNGKELFYLNRVWHGTDIYTETVELKEPYLVKKEPLLDPFSFNLGTFSLITQAVNIGKNPVFYKTWNPELGWEISSLKANSTLSLIKDLNPGPENGFEGDYSIQNYQYLDDSNSLFFIGTNGIDSFQYLYFTDADTIYSFFPIGKNRYNSSYLNHTLLLKHNNYFFWKSWDKTTIQYRKLDEKDPQRKNVRLDSIQYISNTETSEWHRQISMVPLEVNISAVANLRINPRNILVDSSKNIYVLASNSTYGQSGIYSIDSKSLIGKNKGVNILLKYDNEGNLIWHKSFNNYFWGENSGKMTFDQDQNLIFGGMFRNKFEFDDTTINTPNNRVSFFTMKINKETGELIWFKQFATESNNNYYFNDIICDNESNIYLSIQHRYSIMLANGVRLNSNTNQKTSIIKLNNSGGIVWAKSLDSEVVPEIHFRNQLVYLKKENSFLLIASDQFSSSANYHNWLYSILKFNANGEILNVQKKFCEGYRSKVVSDLVNNKELFMSGFNSLPLTPNEEKISSVKSLSVCDGNTNFYQRLTTDFANSVLNTSSVNDFIAFNITHDKEHVYLIGFEQVNKDMRSLCIRRYTHNGVYTAKRTFDFSPTRWSDYYHEGDFPILSLDSFLIFSTISRYQISPYTNYIQAYSRPHNSLSTYKLNKNIGWEEVEHFTEEDKEKKVVFNPNPASEFVDIHFMGEPQYSELAIYDLSGRKIRTIVLNGDVYQRIYISDLSTGMYILRLTGKESYSHKLIKH